VRGAQWLDWLASLPADERDAAVEELLGIGGQAPPSTPPGEHLIGYHATGVAPIVRMLIEVPVGRGDVFIDLGAGLGKVVLLAAILTDASARGIELQGALVERAREAAAQLRVDVRFEQGDARELDLDDGTIFFLYLPFTGPALVDVLRRLHAIACRRAIVVCALAIDLERWAPWLQRRPGDSFWMAIYDSAVEGATPRVAGERSDILSAAADAIAFEREAP
jgi:SAM-dependent methyltransferase